LAYRWFCGLSIEDKIPDHSAFSRARNERFRNSDMFRRVFERVVEACIAAGLVGGEGFAVDASLIVADANKQRSKSHAASTRTLATPPAHSLTRKPSNNRVATENAFPSQGRLCAGREEGRAICTHPRPI
jgi:IS5 family transposase